ncbi:hypothetical protein [Edaphobacter flagellatus]|uniref:hypothetical protein n=1 Tax=Edaphobacter flagellatus TaxID=1933044 RepID=UPI0021B4A7F7|nr:hypothetical protein [Edaphobacter flagellatus]
MRLHLKRWTSCALLTAGLCALKSAATPGVSAVATSRMRQLPRLTVWAWERREDLRAIDPRSTAIAYLTKTVVLDAHGLAVTPRHQGLLLPAAEELVRIPVVRIETGEGAELTDATAELAAAAIVEAVSQSSAALQIDFDAKASERVWYRSVLARVRLKLPAKMPLSMTALASWCSYDNAWLHDLPVDEAVPMLFRMEPDRRQFAPNQLRDVAREFLLREPKCMDAVGISTREAWPRELARRRVYVFADRGWQRDGLEETVRELW